tara:strand:- start:728 stop:922 length:195 start_codon:yes stop_codon:yes gene_type:complete
MANTVIVKKNSSSGNEPGSSDIEVGELAVNTADAKIFTKHTDGSIKTLGKDVANEATALAIALG